MNKILHSLLIIILVVLALAGGFVGGVYFTKQQYAQSPVLNVQGLVLSTTVFGRVISISGSNMVVDVDGKRILISPGNNAKVLATQERPGSPGVFESVSAVFSDIKPGDYVNAGVTLAGDKLVFSTITIVDPKVSENSKNK